MQGWFSIGSLIGMAIAAAFAVYARRDLRQAVSWYAVLGAIPYFQVGAFSGNDMVQGMPLAIVLANVLIVLWLAGPRRERPRRLLFWEKAMLLLVPLAILSIFSGFTFLDRTVPLQNVKVSVSIGQILLFVWPMGLYFVVSDVVDGRDWTDRFTRLVMLLAVPQVIFLAIPALKPYLFWSTYFGVIAAPLAFTRATYETVTWKKVALTLFLVPPLIEGLVTGKAFLYGYIVLLSAVILWVRARWVFWMAAPIGMVALTIAVIVPDAAALLPGPIEELIKTEESQQSWGGRTGRGALLADAVSIWSTHPVFGVGPANSYPYMLRYSAIGTPHSQYADILLETGIVGMTAFMLFILGLLHFGWRLLTVPRPQESQIFLLAWFASFVALSVMAITGDYILHSIRNGGIEMFSAFYLFWVFLGAAIGLARHDRLGRAERPRHVTPPPQRPRAWLPQTGLRPPHRPGRVAATGGR